ncbi:hypothetical protein Apa02nite_079690 [Actinoplanes palleronii]|uniref:Uncharacterized protein n=1 Tax=Actinoplanes palleronii TaxID=113570 RepID=A0ABQ4BNL3_9ACTN|nr:hypothetical protein Apa02nite_079690 [Actinoplanes palleronii]
MITVSRATAAATLGQGDGVAVVVSGCTWVDMSFSLANDCSFLSLEAAVPRVKNERSLYDSAHAPRS